MPMPDPQTSWPPKPFDTAFRQMATWDAWYVGDPDALHNAYAGGGPKVRPSQMAGGVVGAVSRWFWGRPTPLGTSRNRLHVPVPADLATTSADLLFSEAPRIVLPGRREAGVAVRNASQDRLEELVNGDEVHSTLLEAAELSAALGGTYLRVVWDAEVADRPMLTAVHADGAIPTWRWGQLDSVLFWTTAHVDGQVVYRHLESHERGRIVHALYQGTVDKIGRPVPLEDLPATTWLVPLVDAEGALPTGSDGLTAAYVPNVRPSRRWRKTPELAPLGRSDFDGVEGLFDALDETYSSWMRDVRLAKARLFVGQGALQTRGPGQGAWFDDDQEVFTELAGLGKLADGSLVDAQQFDIRHEEHRATTLDLLKAILRATGYSPATFGDDPLSDRGTTATEVKAREKLSNRTRDKKARYWAAELGRLTKVMLDVDREVFRGPGTDEVPEVRFPPTPQEDTLELAQVAQTLKAAEAASLQTRVRIVHPEWDGDAVDAEVERIQTETKQDFADAFTVRPGVDEEA